MNVQKQQLLDMLHDWWNEFDNDDDTQTFEQLYEKWNSEIKLINLELPPFKKVDFALNHIAVTRKQFHNYFLNLLP